MLRKLNSGRGLQNSLPIPPLSPSELAEELIFWVASVSVCVSVRLFVPYSLNHSTIGPTDLYVGTHTKGHYISDKFEGHGSKVKVTKVKNVKILVFNIVSD